MPIYEYLCGACGHSLDALQKISDEPLVHCPTCGEPQLKRQLSAPRFRLKGSGWYETDFKGKGDKKRNLAESDSKAADPGVKAGDKSADKAADKAPGKSAEKGGDKPAAKPADSKPASGKADSVA
ncbi:FmdB family zinc ribbon protein [Thioalkalivibrio sp. XN279]|uniref:FmdB family zinc ribbon protein n=1 Tax=Thioalkalivibrio sp. XN279 TaxID=2714953 RepID=UPI00140DC3F7|nr:zinc ribbon domain-containing protein [Thioalkalivibrio sp. XN279]NHA16029.1 zinc ribbon domain-containing protein [Thioalkalivibrio sp. XN279]